MPRCKRRRIEKIIRRKSSKKEKKKYTTKRAGLSKIRRKHPLKPITKSNTDGSK